MSTYLGWKAGPEQYEPRELLKHVVLAEQAGFDVIDVSDHFHPWSQEGQSCFTWTWLGAAAVKTERIVLGTGLTCPFLRYHPSIVAQAAATVTHFAPGRFYLGVGTGEALNEFSSVGKWPNYAKRREMMIEAIMLMRRLWDGEKVSFSGQYFETHKAKLYTPPKANIPIYVSSLVPESASTAGRYGDGLLTVGGGDPEKFRKIIEEFKRTMRKGGKEFDKAHKMVELGVAFTDDQEEIITHHKKFWAGAAVPAVYNQRIYSPEMIEKNGSVVGSEYLARNILISSDPEDHIEMVKNYLDLGFTDIIFHYTGPNQEKFLEDYGREVLPLIRETVEVPMQKDYF